MSEEKDMVQCPYNVSHDILRHRLASHLIKCRQLNPTVKYETCPFNATHDIPAPELQYHLKHCPDRKQLENYIYVVDEPKPEPEIVVPIEMPPSVENWDEERTCGSYLDAKNKLMEKELVLRQPVGMSKASKKEFLKKEVKRFGSTSK